MKKALLLLQLMFVISYSYAQNINIGTQTFTYGNTTVYHYGLGWYNDPALTAGAVAYFTSFGGMRFFTAGLSKATLDVNGNFGIGNDAPSQKLDVSGNILLRNLANTTGAGASLSFSSYDAAHPGPKISSYLDFAAGTASSSRLILSSYNNGYMNELTLKGGSVGVGTINPIGNLDVRGKTFIGTSDVAIGTTGSFLQIDQGAASGNTYSQIRAFNTGGSVAGDLVLQGSGGNTGIGTAAPTQKLDVAGNMLLRNLSNTPGAGASLSFSSYDAAHIGPKISSYLDNASGTSSSSRLILSSYYNGYMNELTLVGGRVGIGTINPQKTLSVKGEILAQAITVTNAAASWPDYVFDQTYHLQSLENLEKYLVKNKHLPDMPSANEIEANGQNLGEVNSKLLKNVEELTLYLIEKDKQLKDQQSRIEMQDQKILKLEKTISEVLEKIK
ncbi:hypothetical protein [Pedobacter sp. L105]|uniref:hypothetical protein n=1 Tax=Pedobacter sp. L105 TaxID=1641871 RepID=UPI00131B4950|nr:hypothetical protein [Pedobacter sp. L105]